MNGACNSTSFGPAPWGPEEGSTKFQLQSQFQRFLFQTLCVLSKIKDIKFIEPDFYSFFRVTPEGRNLG